MKESLMKDVATAATAVRNLNGYDIGTRQLRVDFSEKQGTGGSTTTSNVLDYKYLVNSSLKEPIYYLRCQKENHRRLV